MKYRILYFAILNGLFWTVVQGEEGCPPPEDIEPCHCFNSPFPVLECSGINTDEFLRGVFQHSKRYSYREVHLHFSSLKYLPKEMFDNTKVLELYIQNSTLNALFDSPPDGLEQLRKLHLENSKITELSSHWELITPLTHLKTLEIYYNLIEVIDSTFGYYVPKDLDQLSLYSTGTKEIKEGAFLLFPKLTRIGVDGCKLKHLSRGFFPNPFNVYDLYFNDNELSSIPNDLFTNMPYLRSVGLRNNMLKTISGSSFDGSVARLEYFTLEGNPLKCDCSLLWLLNSKPKYLVGSCVTPIRLHDRKLHELSSSDLKC